jgi:peptidoglycan/LPS O-acetylase OafA/YrhL
MPSHPSSHPIRERLPQIAAWILAAFFVVGGMANIVGPQAILDDYRRWGFPGWFHYVTGGMELLTALFLVRNGTRWIGAALGALVMAAAAATLLLHGEWGHALLPLGLLAVLALLGRVAFSRR